MTKPAGDDEPMSPDVPPHDARLGPLIFIVLLVIAVTFLILFVAMMSVGAVHGR